MTAKQELLQVKLEFGHKASCRNRPTPEGFTHDWIVFVRGQEDKDISHFVEKVVFNLHDSFHKPKRVIKDPPFKVEEHGYGSFSLPIDVYFKNKEQPKTVRIEYDLFLPAFGNPTIHNNRTEALKFLNPPEEFKKKVLKAGGEMLCTVNGSNVSPSSNQNSVNGNAALHHGEISGKEMKETASINEAEKTKKPKLDKQVKASNTGNKVTSIANKRPSDDDEVLPKVKKKKKKVEENPQVSAKSTGFIPIEPPASGEEEQHIIGNSKDGKLKIKSLPSSKTSKKSSKPQEKVVDRLLDKKKEKQINVTDLNNSVVHSSNGDASKKKTVTSSKSKVKSPQDCKPKITKPEERKVEKLMFRRESGDSWSSSTSSGSPSLPLLGNNIAAKNNALGTLMAELSDHDNDDEDEDIDISTPLQGDTFGTKIDSSLSNVLNKKDKSSKAKTKTRDIKDTKKDQKETKKTSHNSKNGGSSVKSPPNTSKASESPKSATKINSKSKARNKNGRNGHQIPIPDLVDLHKELSSLKDRESLQRVVDILEKSGCFVITDTNLEFDLVRLDMTTIRQIQKCVKR